MQKRTFTAGYLEPMRDEGASLAEAFDEYAADARLRLKPSTWRTCHHYVPAFVASGATQLRDLTPLRVKAFVNQYTLQRKVHGAHNAMIALRALATWLAKEKIFYAPGGGSTLADLALPPVPKTGRPAYTPDEVQKIERVIADHPHSPLLAAVHWLQLGTGIRSNETRLLTNTRCRPPSRRQRLPGSHRRPRREHQDRSRGPRDSS